VLQSGTIRRQARRYADEETVFETLSREVQQPQEHYGWRPVHHGASVTKSRQEAGKVFLAGLFY
jgi:hypothetical protein